MRQLRQCAGHCPVSSSHPQQVHKLLLRVAYPPDKGMTSFLYKLEEATVVSEHVLPSSSPPFPHFRRGSWYYGEQKCIILFTACTAHASPGEVRTWAGQRKIREALVQGVGIALLQRHPGEQRFVRVSHKFRYTSCVRESKVTAPDAGRRTSCKATEPKAHGRRPQVLVIEKSFISRCLHNNLHFVLRPERKGMDVFDFRLPMKRFKL